MTIHKCAPTLTPPPGMGRYGYGKGRPGKADMRIAAHADRAALRLPGGHAGAAVQGHRGRAGAGAGLVRRAQPALRRGRARRGARGHPAPAVALSPKSYAGATSRGHGGRAEAGVGLARPGQPLLWRGRACCDPPCVSLSGGCFGVMPFHAGCTLMHRIRLGQLSCSPLSMRLHLFCVYFPALTNYFYSSSLCLGAAVLNCCLNAMRRP